MRKNLFAYGSVLIQAQLEARSMFKVMVLCQEVVKFVLVDMHTSSPTSVVAGREGNDLK